VAGRRLGDAGGSNGFPKGPLKDGFMEVMAAALAGAGVEVVTGGRKDPLPGPVARSMREFDYESAWKLHVAGTRSKVGPVLLVNASEVLAEGSSDLEGE
jgi:hypothetical protein